MSSEIRLDQVMKSIDVYGRLAFGAQCVAAMAIVAGPLLLITASIWPYFHWDAEHMRAFLAMLCGWAVAVAVTAAGMGAGFIAWRWNGDWITEWYGYAVGFGIAIVANAVLAFLLTSSPVPIYASFIIAAAGAFVAGSLVANRLGGSRVLDRQFEARQRGQNALVRRR